MGGLTIIGSGTAPGWADSGAPPEIAANERTKDRSTPWQRHIPIAHGRIPAGKRWNGYYAHSKLANGLFSLELSKLLRGTRATSNCLSPGPVDTNIRRHLAKDKWPEKLITPAEGASTVCYVAAHPSLAHVTGEYFRYCSPAPQHEYQTDAAMARKLWDVSTELTRKHLT